jgi:hypothetical protein
MAPSSQSLEPPRYPGRFKLAKEMADESARWKRIVTEQRITAEAN